MRRILPFVIGAILILGGLSTAAFSTTPQEPLKITETLRFLTPEIQQKDGYSLVSIKNTNTWLRETQAPMLPASTQTYLFPFGTKIIAVDVTFSAPEHYTLQQTIMPAPAPVAQVAGMKITAAPQKQALPAIYPETLFDYHLGAGVSNQEHVIFLTIRCHPVQYNTIDNTILYRNKAEISITYEPPATEKSTTEDHQLLLIAPKVFSNELQPLVQHKQNNGLTTKLVTLDEIYSSVYFPVQGRDCAEEVKYFIKNAFDYWGTKYVLLIGGRYGGVMQEKWWVPVRYSHLDDGYNWEGSYLSDLYFADLYDAQGNFSCWDSNGNDIFGEWNDQGKDILDMYPDLSVGRLACKTKTEVKTLVNKIITYETTTSGSDWFKNMVVVGGDSAPSPEDPWYEGEEENKLALEYMSDFEGVRLWTSDGSLTGRKDVVSAINQGCGFLFFDGHGNPRSWSTHPPHDETVWIDGLHVTDMPKLTNAERLPVALCGGCHNGQFNTSLLNILKGLINERLKYFQWTFFLSEWTPSCWAWKLVSVPNGGSIATMAYTGLDWFAVGDYNNDTIPDCVQFLSGYLNTQFFYNYGVNNITILGDAHTQALIDYLNAFPPMDEKLDCKTVQEFVLLGDPSLQIGGYA